MAFKMKRNKSNFPFKNSPLKLLVDPYQVNVDKQLEHAAGNAVRDYKAKFDRHRLGHNSTGGDFDNQPMYTAPNSHTINLANKTLEKRLNIINDRMKTRADWKSGKTAQLNKIYADRDNDADWKSGKYTADEWISKKKSELGTRTKRKSPMKSLGKRITRALGGGKKIPGCKYNPGG